MNSGDKTYYDNKLVADVSKERYNGFVDTLFRYFKSYTSLIEEYGRKKGSIKCLELGAGSCSLSLFISKFDFVNEIICLDISEKRMLEYSAESNKIIKGNIEKLQFKEHDFNRQLPFENNSIDIILFDASLHHSRSIWDTLNECNRICKAGGMVIAQREQYLSLLTSKYKMSSLLETEEVKNGVSENAYLKHQYNYYFKATGFKTVFIPVMERGWQKFIPFLNGILFDKWVIIAEK